MAEFEHQTLLYESTHKLPEIFTTDDIQKMLVTIDNSQDYPRDENWRKWLKCRDKTILMTIYLLALRPNEACCIKFEDFNSADGTIKIRGENNKVKKDRILPIPGKLVVILFDYLQYKQKSYGRFWKGSSYLFPSVESPHISSQRWKSIMREKILKPAGIWRPPENSTHPPYRSYTLRHTRATELLNKTNDIYLIANLLGHSKLDSTKVYIHKSKSYTEYLRTALN